MITGKVVLRNDYAVYVWYGPLMVIDVKKRKTDRRPLYTIYLREKNNTELGAIASAGKDVMQKANERRKEIAELKASEKETESNV